jgi:hypothetical protein
MKEPAVKNTIRENSWKLKNWFIQARSSKHSDKWILQERPRQVFPGNSALFLRSLEGRYNEVLLYVSIKKKYQV